MIPGIVRSIHDFSLSFLLQNCQGLFEPSQLAQTVDTGDISAPSACIRGLSICQHCYRTWSFAIKFVVTKWSYYVVPVYCGPGIFFCHTLFDVYFGVVLIDRFLIVKAKLIWPYYG